MYSDHIYYAGVGSRRTPKEICDMMEDTAMNLSNHGLILRSGGAEGADSAFEGGVLKSKNTHNREIYVTSGSKCIDSCYYALGEMPTEIYNDAVESITKYHPNPEAVLRKHWDTQLMARNFLQIHGRFQPYVKSTFVLCWTDGGSGIGGTGQAIRIARNKAIDVWDIGKITKDPQLYSFWDMFDEYIATEIIGG